jgi:hypothetical protein
LQGCSVTLSKRRPTAAATTDGEVVFAIAGVGVCPLSCLCALLRVREKTQNFVSRESDVDKISLLPWFYSKLSKSPLRQKFSAMPFLRDTTENFSVFTGSGVQGCKEFLINFACAHNENACV